MMEFKLPELGENVETAEVVKVLVSEGDEIRKDQEVLSLESEKAAFDLPCPHAGRVMKIHVGEGDTISVGDVVLTLDEVEAKEKAEAEERAPTEAVETDGEETEQEKAERPKRREKPAEEEEPVAAKPETAPPEREEPAEGPKPGRRTVVKREGAKPNGRGRPEERRIPAPAGPATRRLARELGVDLYQVTGSARGGRITRDDVKQFARQRLTSPQVRPQAAELPDFTQWGPVERRRMSKLQRTSAERLARTWQTVPHVTQHELADVTELERARKEHDAQRKEGDPKITITALIVKAAVAALKAYPEFNSSLDASSGELVLKRYYHIGIAVDTDSGLLVPVIRNADRKSVLEVARELGELAERARDRKLGLEEMRGGTFTITNLGGIGGTAFTPIINYPEVAILGVARARQERPTGGPSSEPRLMLPLCLSYDHRAIDGAAGARFIVKIAQLLSDPSMLLLEA